MQQAHKNNFYLKCFDTVIQKVPKHLPNDWTTPEIKSEVNILVTFNIVANKYWQRTLFQYIKDSKYPVYFQEQHSRDPPARLMTC